MHAQPGTVGYPENDGTLTTEIVVSVRWPAFMVEGLQGTAEAFASALAGDFVDILNEEFARSLVPDARPEIACRGRVL